MVATRRLFVLWLAFFGSFTAYCQEITLVQELRLEQFKAQVEVKNGAAEPYRRWVDVDIDENDQELWLLFTLTNQSTDTYEWIFDFRKNDYVGVKVFEGQNALEVDSVGYLVPGSLKKLGRGNFSSYVVPPGQSRTFEVHLVRSPHLLDARLEIRPIHLWVDRQRSNLVGDIAFVSILFIFSIYNFIFFVQSRRTSYLYLGGYLMVVGIFFLFVSMLMRDYIFPEQPHVTLYFMATALIGPYFHWRFIQSLVNAHQLIPRMDRVMNWVVYLCLGLSALQLLLFALDQPYKLISHITQYGVIVDILFSLVAYVLLLRRKDPISSYFLYGTIIMMLGAFYDALIWDAQEDLTRISRIGFLIEIVFFSLGLGKRIQMDTDRTQNQLARLVDQRTADLNQQRNFFAKVLNDVNSLVFVRDENSRIVFCNDQYAALYDLNPRELMGKRLEDLAGHRPDFLARLQSQDNKIWSGPPDQPMSTEESSPADENLWMRVSKKKIIIDGTPYLLGVLFDISTLKETQKKLQNTNEQLQRKIDDLQNAEGKLIEFEKMASIGQLTSGLAHEIGNPVNYLAGNVKPLVADLREMEQLVDMVEQNRGYLQKSQAGKEMLRFFDEVDFHYTLEEVKQLMEGIEHGSTRVKTLVESFRDFSRADSDKMVPSDLNRAIHSTIRLIEHTIKDQVKLEVDLDPDLPMINCSVGQISQVFLNLINNAVQSMAKGGTLTIRSKTFKTSAIFEVKDTGTGIAKKDQKRIFEPFYTTKEVGKGTGLGLSMSKNIVTRHGGKIKVESSVGRGSTFSIELPLKGLEV